MKKGSPPRADAGSGAPRADLNGGFISTVSFLIFAVVNAAAARDRVFAGAALALPVTGSLACLGAVGILVLQLVRDGPETLMAIGVIAAILLALRGSFLCAWTPPGPPPAPESR